MVENPLAVIDDWIKAGAKRIIIHIETLELKSLKIEKLKNYASDCEIGLAINPETPIEDLIPFLSATIDSSKSFMQILAVNPGLSGQKFQPQVLDKIKLWNVKITAISQYLLPIIMIMMGIILLWLTMK